MFDKELTFKDYGKSRAKQANAVNFPYMEYKRVDGELRCVYWEDEDGNINVFDDYGNCIYDTDAEGRWSKSKFEKFGDKWVKVHYIDWEGDEEFWENNEHGNTLYWYNNKGEWERFEYDEQGNETYRIDNDGDYEIKVYNDMAQIVSITEDYITLGTSITEGQARRISEIISE